jgi:hypothetical protein
MSSKGDNETSSSSSSEDEGNKSTPKNPPKNTPKRRNVIKRNRSPDRNPGFEGRNIRSRYGEGTSESGARRHYRFDEDDEEFGDWFERFMEQATKVPEPEPEVEIKWLEYTKEIKTLEDLIELGKSYDEKSTEKYYFPQERLQKLVEPLTELNNMIGMEKLKSTLLNHILFFSQDLEKRSPHMMHTVIYGPPGSGKTCVANILAKIYARMGFLKNEKVHSVRRSDLIGQYLGQTAIKTQKAIDEAKGGVLLIDEAYSLGNPEGRDIYSKECIDTLCQNLSEGKSEFICIIIGYKESLKKCFFAYNPGLERRFPYRYGMDEYDATHLWRILKKMVSEAEWFWLDDLSGESGENKILEFLKKNRHYFKYNGGDLETFLQMLKLAHGKRVFGRNPLCYKKLNWEDWTKAFELFLLNDEIKRRNENEDGFLATMYT